MLYYVLLIFSFWLSDFFSKLRFLGIRIKILNKIFLFIVYFTNNHGQSWFEKNFIKQRITKHLYFLFKIFNQKIKTCNKARHSFKLMFRSWQKINFSILGPRDNERGVKNIILKKHNISCLIYNLKLLCSCGSDRCRSRKISKFTYSFAIFNKFWNKKCEII